MILKHYLYRIIKYDNCTMLKLLLKNIYVYSKCLNLRFKQLESINLNLNGLYLLFKKVSAFLIDSFQKRFYKLAKANTLFRVF